MAERKTPWNRWGKTYDKSGDVVSEFDSIGILTLAKQSTVYVSADATAQYIPDSLEVRLQFNTEVADVQNEFNSRSITGTADATGANKLHDADGGFEAGDVGAIVWNTTDNTYTTVSAFVDAGELTLAADIMVDTETYELFHCKFTAIKAGGYFIGVKITWTDLPDTSNFYVALKKNATYLASAWVNTGTTGNISGNAFGIVTLAANDSVDAAVMQVSGAVEDLAATTNCQLYITKIL